MPPTLPAPLLSPLLWQQQLVGCKGDRLCLLTHSSISAQSWGNLSLPHLSRFRARRRERGVAVVHVWGRSGTKERGCGEQMAVGTGRGGMARSTSTVCVKEKVMREERAGTAPSQHRQGDFFWTFVTQGWPMVNLLVTTRGGLAWFVLQVHKQRSFFCSSSLTSSPNGVQTLQSLHPSSRDGVSRLNWVRFCHI